MIKVFCGAVSYSLQEEYFQRKIDEWLEKNPSIEIVNIHTNSNQYTCMIVIQYKI